MAHPLPRHLSWTVKRWRKEIKASEDEKEPDGQLKFGFFFLARFQGNFSTWWVVDRKVGQDEGSILFVGRPLSFQLVWNGKMRFGKGGIDPWAFWKRPQCREAYSHGAVKATFLIFIAYLSLFRRHGRRGSSRKVNINFSFWPQWWYHSTACNFNFALETFTRISSPSIWGNLPTSSLSPSLYIISRPRILIRVT